MSPTARRLCRAGLLSLHVGRRRSVSGMPLRWHTERFAALDSLGQGELFYDEFGRMCGYALWTLLSSECSFVRMRPHCIEATDMRRSGVLVILDLLGMYGRTKDILFELRDREFREEETAKYFRQKEQLQILKEIMRSRRHGFFRALAGERRPGPMLLETTEGAKYRSSTKHAIEHAICLGACLELAARSPGTSALTLSMAVERFQVPIMLRQCQVFWTAKGEPGSAVTWAWLDDAAAVEKDASRGPVPPSMWNEGKNLNIMDILSPVGEEEVVGAWVRDNVAAGSSGALNARWQDYA